MENQDDKEKNGNGGAGREAGTSLSTRSMEWLRREKAKYMAEGKKAPTYAEIIDGLIDRSESSGIKIPYERPLTYEESVIKSNNESTVHAELAQIIGAISDLRQAIEKQGSIDYKKIERAFRDTIRRLDLVKHGRSLSEIERIKSESKEKSERSGKGTGRSNPKRGLA